MSDGFNIDELSGIVYSEHPLLSILACSQK